MEYSFKEAKENEIPQIWEILQQAIMRRKEDGSNQWQDGYPNPEVIKNDIQKHAGYILALDGRIAGYCAILVNDEPAYASIKGEWLTNEDFIVFHRVAVSDQYVGKGMATLMLLYIEKLAVEKGIKSIKADTNHDNAAMLNIFNKTGYEYCGEVLLRGSSRMAFEKVL